MFVKFFFFFNFFKYFLLLITPLEAQYILKSSFQVVYECPVMKNCSRKEGTAFLLFITISGMVMMLHPFLKPSITKEL